MRSILVLAALALPVVACQLLVGIDDHDFKVAEAGAPPEAGGGDVAEAGPESCRFGAVPPGRPVVADSTDQAKIVFGLSAASLRGRDPDGGVLGFDLDGVCTCDPRDDSRGRGGPSCAAPVMPLRAGGCDADAGIDNATADLLDLIAKVPGLNVADQGIQKEIGCGRHTLVYVLQNYNGLANDPDVVITAIEGTGIYAPHAGGVEIDAGSCVSGTLSPDAGQTYPAKFDGTDIWSTSASTPQETIAGWVKDFELVLDGRPSASSGSTVLPVLFGSRVFTIGTPILVAHLVPLDANGRDLAVDGTGVIQSPGGRASSFRLTSGVLAGRAAAADVLSAAGSFHVGSADLCAQPLAYCFLKKATCSAVDTMKLPSFDLQGASCDALSIVLNFDAVVVQLGGPDTTPPPTGDAGCGSDWTDSCDGGAIVCP